MTHPDLATATCAEICSYGERLATFEFGPEVASELRALADHLESRAAADREDPTAAPWVAAHGARILHALADLQRPAGSDHWHGYSRAIHRTSEDPVALAREIMARSFARAGAFARTGRPC